MQPEMQVAYASHSLPSISLLPAVPGTPPLLSISNLWLPGPPITSPQATQFPLTILLPQRETTDILAHSHEAVEVLLQALICLLLQSRDSSELGPVKDLFLLVIDNPKGGDSAVEICLLPPGPPAGQEETWTPLRDILGPARARLQVGGSHRTI